MYPTSLSSSGVSQPVQLFRIVTLAVAMLVLAATFSTPLQAQTYSALYEFGGQTGDPTNPQYSGLIAQGRDGDLYSTAPTDAARSLLFLRRSVQDHTLGHSHSCLRL